MLAPIIAIWATVAPAGYLAGAVWAHKNSKNAEFLPWACAAFPPLAAVLAMVVITQTETETDE